jgi:hypothetical protein
MYGDYDGPNKADKGLQGGSCNRERCQDSPANYYNHGSMSWYCASCAIDIGQDSFNRRDWYESWYPKHGHAMFETADQMIARGNGTRTLQEIDAETRLIRIARREQIMASPNRGDESTTPDRPKRRIITPKAFARKKKFIRH